jgi:hypothetical protein
MIISWVHEFAKKNRNSSLGARTIDQIRNISDKHAMRLTPKRAEIIEAAAKARREVSESLQSKRKNAIDLADKLKNLY